MSARTHIVALLAQAAVAVLLGSLATACLPCDDATGPQCGVQPHKPPTPVTYYSTNFNDGTTGPLDVYAYGGGSCAASTAYVDPGSAHSMKCTIPAPGGAAALQTWFGTSKLVGTPNDPSLDQDLFEQVRFVLAPGAAAAIGGTTCGSSNSGSQFKMHKSVYGQSGSAINGWVMSEISPCSDGNIGMFSEAEMWRNNGHANPWP